MARWHDFHSFTLHCRLSRVPAAIEFFRLAHYFEICWSSAALYQHHHITTIASPRHKLVVMTAVGAL